MDEQQLTEAVDKLQVLVETLEKEATPGSHAKEVGRDLSREAMFEAFIKGHIEKFMELLGTFVAGDALARGISWYAIAVLSVQQLPCIAIGYVVFYVVCKQKRIASLVGFVEDVIDTEAG